MEKSEIIQILSQAENEIQKSDISDKILLLNKYFKCGFSKMCEYNYAYGAGLSIIGRVYNHGGNKNSDYHNGVVYLAEKSKVTSSEIKAIRKAFKSRKGYCYRISYKFDEILKNMIELLMNTDNNIKKMYFKKYKGYTYRGVLAKNQCEAINYAIKEAEGMSSEKIQRIEKIQGNIEMMVCKIK
jgi:hypothetical protein